MSKLSEKIELAKTGRLKPVHGRVSVSHEFTGSESVTRATEYRCSLKFTYMGFVRDDHEQALEALMKNAKKALINEVFGEFLPALIDLRESLYECDIEKAQKILDQLHDQMFS